VLTGSGPQRKSITRGEDWIPQDGGLATFVDLCYLQRCTQFTTLYHEFNCFESPKKTTATTSTFADAQGFKKEN